ncbi:MAG: hypothetical protein ABIP77_05295 [Candidatus Limnocylindrales bacterium]
MRNQATKVALVVSLVVQLLACGAPRPPSPPPAEAHTGFDPIELEMMGDPDWLAAGFGSIWVKHPEGVVSRIDAATATVTARIETGTTSSESCDGIGSGADGIWSCSFHDLVLLDPVTDAVVSTIPAGKIPGQGRLVGAAGRVWVLAGEGDRLIGVSEADKSLSDPIPLPVACTDLGARADVLYVVCERAGRVLRVDPVSAMVTANVPISAPVHVSAASSGVWVASDEGLLRLDPASLETTLTLGDVLIGYLGAIWADETGVWVRRVDPFLTKVDGTSGVQTRVITSPLDGGGDVLFDGTHLWVTDLEHGVLVRMEIPAGP